MGMTVLTSVWYQLAIIHCQHIAGVVICQEIYKLVKNGQGSVPFRPTLINPTLGEAEEYGDGCSSEELVTTVKRCWCEDQTERPDFHALKTIIKRINKYADMTSYT